MGRSDLIYYFKKYKGGGFYIDIGANDPIELSVTKAFYDMGWSGINIEPLRSKCLLLQDKRPRDINLCIGVGSKNERLPLISAGTGSTFSSDIEEKNHLQNKNKFMKPIMVLSDIYEQYCNINQDVHFCKIDVEGFEGQVLEGIKNWNVFRPWIFVIESTLPGTGIPCHEMWEHILIENGYLFAYNTAIERYYIDERREYLLEGFQNIKEFINKNEVVKMRMEIVTPDLRNGV